MRIENVWRKIACLVDTKKECIRRKRDLKEKDKPIPLGLLLQTQKKDMEKIDEEKKLDSDITIAF